MSRILIVCMYLNTFQENWKKLLKGYIGGGDFFCLNTDYMNAEYKLLTDLVPHLQFSSVQSLSRVRLFATPWIAARQASLSISNSQSSLRLMSIESVMPSSHLILCCPLLLLPPIPPSIKVFSNESNLRMRWPKYWGFSFSIIPSKEIPGLEAMKTIKTRDWKTAWGDKTTKWCVLSWMAPGLRKRTIGKN